MQLFRKISLRSLHWVFKALVIVVLSAALAVCAAFNHFEKRASQIFQTITGMPCVIASVRPCFPCGIKANDVTICSASGNPFLQTKELSAQFDLLGFLLKGKQRELFNNLRCDQSTLTLAKNANGEWDLPRLNLQKNRNVAETKQSHRRLVLTNISVDVKTGAGEATRAYDSIVAELDPASESVTLDLSGAGEFARIKIKKGAVKDYELEAENFSLALIAPATAALPLANLVLSGKLRATTSDSKSYDIAGSGKLRITSVHHAVVSSRKLDDITLPFDLKAKHTDNGIEDIRARISLAGETAIIEGSIEGAEKPVIDMTIGFSDFSYDRAFSALPASLHPSLPVVRLSGSMTGTFEIHLDLADPDRLDYSYTGRIDPLRIVNLGKGSEIDQLKTAFVHRVRIEAGNDAAIMVGPDNPDFTPYNKIPRSLISAVMMAEDGSFFSHKGFSTRNIKGSLIDNLKAGRVVRGASTISMQLAKNLFLSQERTLTRKLEEALYTVAIEQSLDKRRIMEIYLNIIEWGNGIYGIGPAARYYFNKEPVQLTPVESAFLATIIARPKNWPPSPLTKIGRGWRHYVQLIVWKMYQTGHAEVDDLLQAGVSEARILDSLMEEETDNHLDATPVGG